MKDQKRNETLELILAIEHSESANLSSSIVTEADFKYTDGRISISITSDSFSDMRARWNSLMRAEVASEQSIDATNGGEKY